VLSVAIPVAAQVSFNATTYPAPVNTSLGFSVAADIDRDGKPDIISTDGSNPQLSAISTGHPVTLLWAISTTTASWIFSPLPGRATPLIS
jgi:hypothetical protein